MKKFFTFFLLAFCVHSFAQEIAKVDSVAVNLLTKMSTVIGEHTSVSFDLETANDKMNDLKNGEAKYQNWYYGPQTKFFQSINYNFYNPCQWIKIIVNPCNF